ncbi:MAG: hypothetical protein HKN43_02505 [Rhodothermales bacterium]|nr:hypothetical protein [Rhodothermales bacterium]
MAVIILHLSEKEISDLLFVGRLGRFLTVAPRENHKILIVHDGYYQARIVLENEGHDVANLTQEDWAGSAAAVFTGIKALTRQIVNGLTDQGVAAVGMQGADRNLVALKDGQPVCPVPDRLSDLAANGIVPVLGPIISSTDGEKALESAELICQSIGDALAGSHDVTIGKFSDNPENVEAGALNTYKSAAYTNFDSSISVELIRAENLADTEFWERFS